MPPGRGVRPAGAGRFGGGLATRDEVAFRPGLRKLEGIEIMRKSHPRSGVLGFRPRLASPGKLYRLATLQVAPGAYHEARVMHGVIAAPNAAREVVRRRAGCPNPGCIPRRPLLPRHHLLRVTGAIAPFVPGNLEGCQLVAGGGASPRAIPPEPGKKGNCILEGCQISFNVPSRVICANTSGTPSGVPSITAPVRWSFPAAAGNDTPATGWQPSRLLVG